MANIKEEAFVFSMDYVHNIMDYIVEDELSNDESDVPFFRNIHISDCNCVNAYRGVTIKGLEGRDDTISDVIFDNCHFKAVEENLLKNCKIIIF